jgi:hypothetical protein
MLATLGIYLGLVFLIFRFIIYHPSITRYKRRVYLGFGGVLFLLNMFAFMCMPLIGQQMWIVHRGDTPPYTYYMKHATGQDISWHMVFADMSQVLSMFLSDALLVCISLGYLSTHTVITVVSLTYLPYLLRYIVVI